MSKRTAAQKIKSFIIVCGGSAVAYSGLCLYQGNEKFYESCIMPVVHSLDPELSHKIAITANKYGLIPRARYKDPPEIRSRVWGVEFPNPLGLAAGFDKDGEAVEGLLQLGFGFVEIGSVTPLPQPGNPPPRVFRLPSNNAIINRYGFNSEGHSAVAERLKALVAGGRTGGGLVGVNLGKNKDSDSPIEDYTQGVRLFAPLADYLVINVSSPNTPGLRDWQGKEQLKALLSAVKAARDETERRPPLLLKLAPDLGFQQLSDIAALISTPQCRVDGMVISNTTTERPPELEGAAAAERGGLSGAPIRSPSTNMVANMYRLTNGSIPIIGVGGVFTGAEALEKMKAGASLVQIYTAFAYHGPPRVQRIKAELAELLKKEGFANVSEAVGSNHKQADASSSAK